MQLSPIKNEHINNCLKLFTQLDVKQLMIFGRTVVAASDLKNCTMVNCVVGNPEDWFSHNEAQISSNMHLISSSGRTEKVFIC